MLLWWTGKWESWDAFWPGACAFVGVGVLATVARYYRKWRAMQAIPTKPVWTPPFEATGNIAPIIEVEYRRLPD